MELEEAKRRARSGSTVLFLRRVFGLVITFVSMVTIARIVGPRAFGIANMAMIIMNFAQILRDFGLTNAVLRKSHVSQSELSFIFWFNCATTLSIAAVIALLAPLSARFYNQSVVPSIIFVSLIGFVASGVSGQHRALINKDLRFGTIAVVDTISVLIGFCTSITLAYIWANVWAIVIGTVTQLTVNSILYFSAIKWRPDWPSIIPEAKSLIAFGGNSAVFSLSVFLSGNVGPIVIGHLLGPVSLGQYNRAWALFSLPGNNLIEPIAQATMPLLNRLRSDAVEYREAYLSLVRKLCTFLMPMSVGVSFGAVPLTESLLGPKWHEAGLVLAALAPSFFAMGIGYSLGDLFVTQDRSKELGWIGIFEMIVRIVSVFAGVQFGLVGAALGYTFSTVLAVFTRMLMAGRSGPVTTVDQILAAAVGIPIAFGSFIFCGGLFICISQPTNSYAQTIYYLASALVGGICFGAVISPCRKAIFELARTFGADTAWIVVQRHLIGRRTTYPGQISGQRGFPTPDDMIDPTDESSRP